MRRGIPPIEAGGTVSQIRIDQVAGIKSLG
eukprot:IDg2344t1